MKMKKYRITYKQPVKPTYKIKNPYCPYEFGEYG